MIIYVLSCLLLITSIFTLIYLFTKKLRSVEEIETIEVIEIADLKPKKVRAKKTKGKKQIVAKPISEVILNLEVEEEIKSEQNKVEVEEINPIVQKKEKIPYKRRIKNKKEIDDSINIVLDNKHEMLDFQIPKSIFNTDFKDIKHCVITQYHADNTSAYSRQIISKDDFLEVLSKIKRYSSNTMSGYKFSIIFDGIEEVYNLTTTIT